MENMLVKFVHRRKRIVGCVIAKKFDDRNLVVVTGSLCHVNKDRYNKEEGLRIAVERALLMADQKPGKSRAKAGQKPGKSQRSCEVPFSLRSDLENMIDRADRYFKDSEVIYSSIKE